MNVLAIDSVKTQIRFVFLLYVYDFLSFVQRKLINSIFFIYINIYDSGYSDFSFPKTFGISLHTKGILYTTEILFNKHSKL